VYTLSDRVLFFTLKPGFAKDFSFAKLYKNYPNLTVGFTCFKKTNNINGEAFWLGPI
jgi:hypothetical protein